MTSLPIVNETTMVSIEQWKGAPLPFTLEDLVSEAPQALPATLTMVITPNGGSTITLTVGSGISLATNGATANGIATVQLSEAQSNLLKEGPYNPFVVTTGAPGTRTLFIAGIITGRSHT